MSTRHDIRSRGKLRSGLCSLAPASLCHCFILLGLLSFCLDAYGQASKSAGEPQGTKRAWHDGKRWRHVWMAHNEIAVFHAPSTVTKQTAESVRSAAEVLVQEAISGATIEKVTGAVTFYRLSEAEDAERIQTRTTSLAQREDVHYSSPVFYPAMPSPDTRMALTGEIIVGFEGVLNEQELAAFAAGFGLTFLKRFRSSPRSALFDARPSGSNSLDLANRIREAEGVTHAYPNWLRQVPLRMPSKEAKGQRDHTNSAGP